jgi:hypothetical protein
MSAITLVAWSKALPPTVPSALVPCMNLAAISLKRPEPFPVMLKSFAADSPVLRLDSASDWEPSAFVTADA